MQFLSASTALAGLLALSPVVAALPQSQPHTNAGTGGNSASNSCDSRDDISIFKDGTKGPDVNDCKVLAAQFAAGNLFPAPATTVTGSGKWHTGTCTFTISVPDGKSIKLGTDDASDLVTSALTDFNLAAGTDGTTQWTANGGKVPCDQPNTAAGESPITVSYNIRRTGRT